MRSSANTDINKNPGISNKTKSIATISLLIFGLISPVFGIAGIVMMWVWTKWKWWVKLIVTVPYLLFSFLMLAGAGFVLIYSFLFRPYQVAGQAMVPSYTDGQYVMTWIYNPENDGIKRGDVIVFRAPPSPEKDFIKRVVALPGESISMRDGKVFVNGQVLDEGGYILKDTYTNSSAFLDEGIPFVIPDGQYFVMGDNRSFSSDSREWGPVTEDAIVGKVGFCYWKCSSK